MDFPRRQIHLRERLQRGTLAPVPDSDDLGMRHFYASALISSGLNPKVIQASLGHAMIGETMGTYAHLFPASDDLGRGAARSQRACAPRRR